MSGSRFSSALMALLIAPLLACGDVTRIGGFATAPSGTGPSLTGLTLTAGALSPGFNATTTAYQTTVPNTTTSIRVIPTASNGNTVRVNGTAVASGAESGDIPLSVGTNTITVEVVNATGGTRTYTIAVRRST
jgi:hypothetical protein